MLTQFSRSEAARVLNVKEGRLRYWDRIGLVKPSLREKGKCYYDFQDLICLRTAQGLVDEGLSASRIKQSIVQLKAKFPGFENRLSSKRIYVFGNRVIISHKNRLIDSHSGQLLFKFDVDDLAGHIDSTVEKLETRPRSAEEWFQRGLSQDSDPATYDDAIHSYKQAVKLSPSLAGAYVNMGTVYYKQKRFVDAQRCFRLAIQREPYHSKAAFNLGNVLDELNCTEEAVQWYERAMEADPTFPDVYFNLAAANEKLGNWETALRYWKAYLQCDEKSPHGKIVRKRIKLLEAELA